jgi:hypothetical protein
MAIAPTSPIGTTLSVSAAAPATYNEAGYEALSWTEVQGIQSIGEIGDRSERISVDLLDTGRRVYANGVKDFAPFPVQMIPSSTDAGQVIVVAGNNTDTLHSFMVSYPDGDELYVTGRIADLVDNALDPNAVRGQSFEIRPSAEQVRGT